MPLFASKDDVGRRFYTWRDESFYSVTTIIGEGVPKHLTAWAAKAVAELVHADLKAKPQGRNAAMVRRWEKAGRRYVAERQAAGELRSIKADKLTPDEFVLRWIKGAPDRLRDEAADRGSEAHKAAEDLVLDALRETTDAWREGRQLPDWPERIAPLMHGFVRWLRDHEPEFIATEATVFNRTQAYAGTLDAIVRLPSGEVPLIDYKTGNRVYPEVGLQLSAYAQGEFIGGADGRTEHPLPLVSGGAVLHLAPERYTFRRVRIDEPVWRSFLYAREVFRWQIETSGSVLGDVIPALREVA